MTARYEVEVIGESREIYSLEAESEQDAMARWMDGDVVLTEVSGAEPIKATKEDD